MNPIFIIGTERSGTNLIRLILNSHPNISVPHPPHILKNFFSLEPLYSDLSIDKNFKRLINDVVTSISFHHHPFGIKINKEKVFSSIKERNLINIFFAIYTQYLENAGKNRWGCKSTFMINHVALIRHYYPKAKFIYVVRDGRDVALSAKKTIFNHYNVYYTADLWKKEQQIGIYWLNRLPREDILLIKYESLLSNPESCIKSICLFLNEPYIAEILNFFETNEAKKCASISCAWQNLSRPIIKTNSGKFKNGLTQKETALFESIAAFELDFFSYALETPFFILEGMCNMKNKFKIIYLFEEVFLRLKVQIKHLFSDRNNMLRFKKFIFLKFIKWSRLLK